MNHYELLLRKAGSLGEKAFLDVERNLVMIYRRYPSEQEAIALAVSKLETTSDSETRERAEELRAMFDHVHDPLISAGALTGEEPQSEGSPTWVRTRSFRGTALSGAGYTDRL